MISPTWKEKKSTIWFRSGILLASTLMIGGTIATSASSVNASADTVQKAPDNSISSEDLETLENLDPNELAYQIAIALQQEGINLEELHDNHEISTRGIKSKAAKVAAKAAIAALKKMGRKAWNKAISSVPIIKGFLKKYLSYESVMKTLNIVSDFEGNIDNAMAKQFQKQGMPKSIAGIAARAITTILL